LNFFESRELLLVAPALLAELGLWLVRSLAFIL